MESGFKNGGGGIQPLVVPKKKEKKKMTRIPGPCNALLGRLARG